MLIPFSERVMCSLAKGLNIIPTQHIWRVTLSHPLTGNIFKIIYGIIKNGRKLGQVASIMYVT